MAKLLNVDDYREAARRRLPRGLFDYVDGGSDDEVTLRANRRAFDDVALLPRGAVWVERPDLGVELFGRRHSMPILTAPCGGMRLVHPTGDCGVARGAAAAGTVAVVASFAGYSAEQVMASSDGPKWFQMYNWADRRIMEGLVARAQAAKYEALVCTIDTAVLGNREKDYRNGFTYDLRVSVRNAIRMAPQLAPRPGWAWRFWRDGMPFDFPNAVIADGTGGPPPSMSTLSQSKGSSVSLTWDDLKWIRSNWEGPLLVKGVLTSHDARLAADAGADGVIVSNHGGRQLDGVPAALVALGDVVESVGGEVAVLLDGGVRRGSDVAKALSLGARAVLVGRPVVWGLAMAGADGVTAVLDILRAELNRTLQLMGRASVRELNRDCVVRH
jgi:isopentenyl diphosphate isomerase/L-lactate dehydrogenase-like FMN-dependent dehydrogenase